KSIPQTSLAIHFSQEGHTDEEHVVFVERLVAEEVFQSVDEVCRFLGVSKTWFYTLKKAAKLRPDAEKLPTSSLALVEKTHLDAEKKKAVVESLQAFPLPRPVLAEALREIVEKPEADPCEIVEKHYWSSPRRVDENTVAVSASFDYFLRKTGGVAVFEARRGVDVVWRVEIPFKDFPMVKQLWQRA
ncbi:MAG: hypothetical protein N3H84_08565, partial [Candidatus Caldarchaeum sp.]|nr:hypothetical protein [Candidatus Caldarchaeum sp.]